MSWRTPSSLKWLIIKRSRLSGQLERLLPKLDSLRGEFEQMEAEVNRLRDQLAALDRTFLLHDIQIDPTGIEPVIPHRHPRLFPNGHMGRHIRRILAEREYGEWTTTPEIAWKIMEHLDISETGGADGVYRSIRRAVRNRLQSLMQAGEVERVIGATTNKDAPGEDQSRWRLARVDSALSESKSRD